MSEGLLIKTRHFLNQIHEASIYFPRHVANINPVLDYDRNALAKGIQMVFFPDFSRNVSEPYLASF